MSRIISPKHTRKSKNRQAKFHENKIASITNERLSSQKRSYKMKDNICDTSDERLITKIWNSRAKKKIEKKIG